MELPTKFLRTARAQASRLRDRAWAQIEDSQGDIDRIVNEGPSAGDEDLVQVLAELVSLELHWRAANRSLVEQGKVEDE